MFKTTWNTHRSIFKERQQDSTRTLQAVACKIDPLVTRIVEAMNTRVVSAYEAELPRLEDQRIV